MNKKAAFKTFLTLCAIVFVPILTSRQITDVETWNQPPPHTSLVFITEWCVGFVCILGVLVAIGIVCTTAGGVYDGFVKSSEDQELDQSSWDD